MRVRGVYRKAYEGFVGDFGVDKMHAKTRRKLKKAMRRRVRRTAENPMDWVYSKGYLEGFIVGYGYFHWVDGSYMSDEDDDFNNYDIDHWIYCFDWNCGEPVDELECLDELYYYSYDGMPMAITDIWYNNWIYQEYMEGSK